MHRSRLSGWKWAATLAVVLAVPLLGLQLGTPASGPYQSALALSGDGQAHAAAYCNDKYCAGGSRHNIVCAKVIGYHCVNLSGGYCSSNPC